MNIGKGLRLAALTCALTLAVTPALVEYADAGKGGRGGGGGIGRGGGGGGMKGLSRGGGGMKGLSRGGGGRHYGGYRGGRHYGGGGKHYGGGKHHSGKHKGHGGHGYYRHGHGYGYWRGGVWIATGIIGYGAGSYCSRLYYYDYYRWLYECQY